MSAENEMDRLAAHTSMARELLLVFKQHPTRSIIVVVGILVSSVGQMLVLSSLYPVLELLSGGSLQEGNRLIQVFVQVFQTAGLETTAGNFLLCFLITACIVAAFQGLNEVYQGHVVRTIETDLRHELIGSTIKARWDYLREVNHGEFVNLVTREAELYKVMVKNGFFLVSAVLHGAILGALALWINWKITIFGLIGIGIGSAVFVPFFKRTARVGQEWTSAFVQLSDRLLAALRSLKTTKASSLEDYVVQDVMVPVKRVGNVYLKQRILEAGQSRAGELLAVGAITAIVYAWLMILQARPSDIIMMLVVFSRLLPQVRSVVDSYHRACGSMGSAEAVRRHLQRSQAETKSLGRLAPPNDWNEIEFLNVTFSYETSGPNVIENLTFTIARGDWYGIVGPTGAGKSTLVDLILGLNQPLKGGILIGGVFLVDMNLPAWHGRIGYLCQEPLVFGGTLRSNLLWGIPETPGDEALWAALEQAQLVDLAVVDPEGLDKKVLENGNNLSGGEKQRLALARCLLRKAEVLILDEPTSALDHASEMKILDALEGLRGRVTVILVTHREELLKACTSVLRFHETGVSIEPWTGRLAEPSRVTRLTR